MSTLKETIIRQCRRASEAASRLSGISADTRKRALDAMASAIIANTESIIEANAKDMDEGRSKGLSSAMLDRLMLDEQRVADMARGLSQVAAFADPVGRSLSTFHRPNGLIIEKVTCPIGVIGIIYESRPNVTADAAGLCLMAGNATILKGGSEALNSNRIIASILQQAGQRAGLPEGFIEFIDSSERESVNHLLVQDDYVHLIIPRGGENLIKFVMANSHIPVIKHSKGVCNIFIDAEADLKKATDILINAKCQRPGVCNAAECVLVHRDIAETLIPKLGEELHNRQVQVRGDEGWCQLDPHAVPAGEEDFGAEYLDLILHARIVDSCDDAIEYINRHGSGHSDAIVSNDKTNCRIFAQRIDSASVYINASTRFTDGSQFGMGAEIGISTDRLHARGPMGVEELTTYKYLITGDGQIRD